MKKRIILVGAVLFLITCFPIRIVYKDGGTVLYKALLYSVTKHHKLIEDRGYQKGTTIKVLGYTLYEKIETSKKEPTKKERMIKINDKIYYDTGKIITVGRCGVGIEQITDFVEEITIPTKNGQVNFKGDIKYQVMTEKEVDVWINDTWYTFESRE